MVKDLKSIQEAVEKALEAPERKFKEGVELAVNLQNIDMSKPQNRIDTDVVLPHGLGRERKIAVFSKGDLALKAENAGALVIAPDDIAKLGGDKKRSRKLVGEYDFFIAEAPLMPSIGKSLGPVLGPRGKMPTPIPSEADIAALMRRLVKTVRMRSKDKLSFHVPVGKREMAAESLSENVEAVVKKLEGTLGRGSQDIKSVYIKTTMGPPVKVI